MTPIHGAAFASGSDGQRLIHDTPDGAGTATALRAAAEAAVDLAGSARGSGCNQGATHVMVRQHIARTNDHRGKRTSCCEENDMIPSLADALARIKKKSASLSFSKLLTAKGNAACRRILQEL
jgi:hypothetical protein